jgi:hypothetical protein
MVGKAHQELGTEASAFRGYHQTVEGFHRIAGTEGPIVAGRGMFHISPRYRINRFKTILS